MTIDTTDRGLVMGQATEKQWVDQGHSSAVMSYIHYVSPADDCGLRWQRA